MPTPDTITVLNRVLASLRQSFPQYVRYARPYLPPKYAGAFETLVDVAKAQDALAERVGEQVIAAGAIPDSGEFPMEFTDTHDLGIDYMIREAVGYQEQDVADLESLAASPDLPPAAQSLVSEALGLSRGQLETLRELQPASLASTIVRNGEPAYKND
jgi:hypothetical protein